MLFEWFNTREAKSFGTALARYWLTQGPNVSTYGDKAFEKKAEKTLQHMAADVQSFRRTHRLNIYKTAQLGNAFRWALTDAGLPEMQVQRLTSWLLMLIRS